MFDWLVMRLVQCIEYIEREREREIYRVQYIEYIEREREIYKVQCIEYIERERERFVECNV